MLLDRTIDDFALSHDGRRILYTRVPSASPARFSPSTCADGEAATPQRLSHFNDEVVNRVDIRPAETHVGHGRGRRENRVFIVKPHDFDPAQEISADPERARRAAEQWTDSFRGDWQVYPGAGYVVAFANPARIHRLRPGFHGRDFRRLGRPGF